MTRPEPPRIGAATADRPSSRSPWLSAYPFTAAWSIHSRSRLTCLGPYGEPRAIRSSRAGPASRSRIFAEAPAPAGHRVPWFQVAEGRLALAALASEFYGRPSERLSLVGITGTNGKTTTSYVLSSIFEAAGVKCGRIGTVGYRIGDREFEAARTTPEAPELQR